MITTKDRLGNVLCVGDRVICVSPIKIKLDGLLLDVSGGTLKSDRIKKIDYHYVYGDKPCSTVVLSCGDFDSNEVIKYG